MRLIPAGDAAQVLDFPSLMDRVRDYFRSGTQAPTPITYQLDGNRVEPSLRLSTAWRMGGYIGVHVQTDFPADPRASIDAITQYSTYMLFNGKTGEPAALIDGPTLRQRSRAACSGLAAQFLARSDSERLLVIGASPLGLAVTQALCAVRPICTMLVYDQRAEQAARLAKILHSKTFRCEVTDDLAAAAEGAHIIFYGPTPDPAAMMLKPEWLQLGQHLDVHLGAARIGADPFNDLRKRLRLFCCHDGDRAGSITPAGSLKSLSQGMGSSRNLYTDITAFWNEGSAAAELAGAKLAFERA